MVVDKIFEEFKEFETLTPDQQNFYIYQQVSKISKFDKRYARKWVENGMKVVIGTILLAVLAMVLNAAGVVAATIEAFNYIK